MSLLVVAIIFFVILLGFELTYFKLADRFDIIDKPNHRSSHTLVTLRGGGIIFIPGFLFSWFYANYQYTYFLMGLLLIGTISFLDDIKPVSRRLRILVHFIGAALLLYQLDLYSYPIYWLVPAFIYIITTINGTNFMDGINGITGGYSLLIILTLFYINRFVTAFTNDYYLVGVITALLVFNLFNFRKKAKCFAGDVGSVSIAFIIAFFLLQLIITSGHLSYLLLLLVYILDTFTTIIFRLIKRENIFEPHRSHFYQFLANEKKIPHLLVAGAYIAFQTLINFFVIKFGFFTSLNFIVLIVLSITTFILMRLVIEGRRRIFNY